MRGTPSPAELRAELEDMIVGDLLGPTGGEHEVLNGRERVRDRYLVGMLAPRGTIALDPERVDKSGSDGDDTGFDAELDDASAATPSLFPSSIGCSFAVGATVHTLRVEASWGRYLKEQREPGDVPEPVGDLAAAGQASPGGAAAPQRSRGVWQRHPAGGTVDIPLQPGELGPVPVSVDQPEVVVTGRASQREGAWLVSLFLVNRQRMLLENKDEAWLFQVGFVVTAPTEAHPDGAPAFVGRAEAVSGTTRFADAHDPDREVALLDLQYRDTVEFAAGHTTAVHATLATTPGGAPDPARAVRIETRQVPVAEVPKVEAPTAGEEPGLAAAVLDMEQLADTATSDLSAALEPLVDAYETWLDGQEARIADPTARLAGHEDAAREAIATARKLAQRLRDGIAVLAEQPDAAEAFRFANRAMWHQRVRTVAIEARRADPDLSLEDALDQADQPRNRSWRPFQLAFVLLNLPSLTDPGHPERSPGADGLVDLLFFPTGGGKTEAYLGLTAYTLAIRRLQGTVAGHDGEGVAVLMRYTLRLLTAQQFQRAASLICASEVLRRQLRRSDPRWGDTPFRLGLWVGAALTPNRNRDSLAALEDARVGSSKSQALQLSACPWCGRPLDPGRDVKGDLDRWRTLVFCSDPLGRCPFTESASEREGIPVVTVDEELYRLLPSLVIATADKFAQLPLRGQLHLLFGRVTQRCTRHGYRSADLDTLTGREEHDKHNKTRLLPPAETVPCNPLRPPDLIIQDELHLISGPLGTLVGLYETAIDQLSSWQVDGRAVRPKVVASTATIRRAAEQVHALFWRDLAVFPPPVLDAGDSFFARQRDPGRSAGRRYLGICAPGQRLKSVEVRVFVSVLAAAQKLFERHGAAADPWMTLVGYFGALRELGGMRRLVDDDVRSRLRRAERRGLANRTGMVVRELTSRVSSHDIRPVLDELALHHDPDRPDGPVRPVDVVLATNMISVGVDVPRLGLMTCVGQPKATAEYIQATSRVGRSPEGPGLVLTIYNWARPRDLSHYETFEHYHATFYRQVEALSVTPFAARALDRGLTAVLVAMVRHHLDEVARWNPNVGADEVVTSHPVISAVIDAIAERAEEVAGTSGTAQQVRTQLQARLDEWAKRQDQAHGGGARLGYQGAATVTALLEPPTLGDWPLWAVPNSLRETEPNVNLIIDTDDRSLGDGGPPFQLGAGEPADTADTAEDGEPLADVVAGQA